MNQTNIESWIIDRLSTFTGKPSSSISSDMSFAKIGLDSATAFALCGELEDWLDVELEPTVFRTHKTIRALAALLAKRSRNSGAP